MRFIVQGYPAFCYTGGKPFDRTKPVLVFIHGAAMDHSVWQWQSRYLAHHGYSVLAVDLPGHGKSPGQARDSIEQIADWIVALLDAAEVTRASVIGHSMGSLVALDCAIRHAARFERLALLGTACPMPVGEAFLGAARDNNADAIDMEAYWGHSPLALMGASTIPGTHLAGASHALISRALRDVQFAGLNACNAYRATAEAIASIKAPTLVIAGNRDLMTPAKAGKAVADAIAGSRFVTVSAGHAMMSEAAVAVTLALTGFFAQQR